MSLLQGARGSPGAPHLTSSKSFAYNISTFLSIVTLLVIVVLPYASLGWNPYEILGVGRDASADQIKRAYRDLAKRFHPDKSSSSEDESGRRFIELNKAFNILKDPTRRLQYDQHGTVDENRHPRGYHSSGRQGGNTYRHSRENWHTHNGYRTFTFFTPTGEGHLRKKSITSKQYLTEFSKESKLRPFLIFFYTDFCPSCSMIESIWIKITEELSRFNVGSVSINVNSESRLSHELGVSSIPHIACLLDGQLYHYYHSEISLASFVRFIKNSLPSNLVPILMNDYEQDKFIAQSISHHNRLVALIINNERNIKLRYLLLAYSLRQYYRFGHISTKVSEYKTLIDQYNLSLGSQSFILVFNERIKKPIMMLQYDPENFSTLDYTRQLLEWPFLKLPKLSSQTLLDDLCLYSIPKDGYRHSTKLCVILFARASPSSLAVRERLLEFIELNGLERDNKVVFAYLDPDKQSEFTESLLIETKETQPDFVKSSIEHSIILIEKQPSHNRKAHYRWIHHRWDPNQRDQLDLAKLELYQCIMDYKQGNLGLRNKVLLNLLIDEEGPSLLDRIYQRLVGNFSRMVFFLTSRELFSAVVILIGCAILTSLFLYKSPVPNQYYGDDGGFQQYCPEPPKFNETKGKTATGGFHHNETHPEEIEMKIVELKAETYNGMIRLLKPGYRSIVVLVDQESKQMLLKSFTKSVRPYRKNKTLIFGYLCLDKNLDWYRALLEQVLGRGGLSVNKRKCIGSKT